VQCRSFPPNAILEGSQIMPYQFQPQDSDLKETFRRIAREELSFAIQHFATDRLSPEAVHDIRKRIKKLQGLLRLLKPGLQDYRTTALALSNIGHGLTARREMEVRLVTFDSLFPVVPPKMIPFRARLVSDLSAPAADQVPGTTHQGLTDLLSVSKSWKLHGKDAAILTAGLARTMDRARYALDDARADPTLDNMHVWRKRAKDHWYQARLFCPVWPEALAPLVHFAGTLTEDLGRHHDLGQLSAFGTDTHLETSAQSVLDTRIKTEMRQIEDRVFPQGRRLFAGEPRAKAKMWVEWWRVWRS
jgi:CHAD domain-containing protein